MTKLKRDIHPGDSYPYGTVLHDSKVAQSGVIILKLWQVPVTFLTCKKGSDQFLSHRLDRPSPVIQLKGLKKITNYSTQSKPNLAWEADLTKKKIIITP